MGEDSFDEDSPKTGVSFVTRRVIVCLRGLRSLSFSPVSAETLRWESARCLRAADAAVRRCTDEGVVVDGVANAAAAAAAAAVAVVGCCRTLPAVLGTGIDMGVGWTTGRRMFGLVTAGAVDSGARPLVVDTAVAGAVVVVAAAAGGGSELELCPTLLPDCSGSGSVQM